MGGGKFNCLEHDWDFFGETVVEIDNASLVESIKDSGSTMTTSVCVVLLAVSSFKPS